MEEIEEENRARAIRDAREDEDDTDKREERKEEKKLVYIEESSSNESSDDEGRRNSGVQNISIEVDQEQQEVKRKTTLVSESQDNSNYDEEDVKDTLKRLGSTIIREATTTKQIGGLLLHPDIFSLTFYGLMKDEHDKQVIENF